MNYIVGTLLILMNPENDKETAKEYYFIDMHFELHVFYIFDFIMKEKNWREVFADGTPRLKVMI